MSTAVQCPLHPLCYEVLQGWEVQASASEHVQEAAELELQRLRFRI